MGRNDRPFIFKTHGCGNTDSGTRHSRLCGNYADCMKGGRTRRRMTSKARRRANRLECKP